MKKHQSITSLPPSPDDDRRKRMINYTIAMSVRMLCLIACFFAPGWWLLLPAVGAIFLPYVAVVLANVSDRSQGVEVLRPDAGALVPVTTPTSDGDRR